MRHLLNAALLRFQQRKITGMIYQTYDAHKSVER